MITRPTHSTSLSHRLNKMRTKFILRRTTNPGRRVMFSMEPKIIDFQVFRIPLKNFSGIILPRLRLATKINSKNQSGTPINNYCNENSKLQWVAKFLKWCLNTSLENTHNCFFLSSKCFLSCWLYHPKSNTMECWFIRFRLFEIIFLNSVIWKTLNFKENVPLSRLLKYNEQKMT